MLVLPSLNVGGMERVMSELADSFIQTHGCEVTLALCTKRKVFYRLNDRVAMVEPTFEFSNRFRILSIVRTLFFLRQVAQKIKPDVVLSFGEMYNSFVILGLLATRNRVFVSDRGDPQKKWGFFHESLRKLLYPRAAGIVCQTNEAKDFVLKNIRSSRVHVIANPVKEFKSDSMLPRERIVLSVGRLIKSKKIDLLLRAFPVDDFPEWKMWVVGDGPERANLEALAVQLGIKDRVTFWGSRLDVDHFYGRSRVFAFTSVSEGFPNALLEARAAGLRCVGFDKVPGVSTIIGTSGALVETISTDAFKNALRIEMKMCDEGSAAQAGDKEEVLKAYSPGYISLQYISFFTRET